MNGRPMAGGVPLGGQPVTVTKITTYPVAITQIIEGGGGYGDATHTLVIVLPTRQEAIHLPYNKQALRQLGREAQRAGGVPMPSSDE